MKRIYLLIAISIAIIFFATRILFINKDHTVSQKPTPVDPKNVVFLWDLHEVVFENNIWDWIQIGWQHERKLETIFKLSPQIITFAGKYLLEKIGLTKTQTTSEEIIAAARQAGNQGLIDLTINIGSAYYPIKGTLAIIDELKQRGYTHHIGSNIGTTVFKALKEKFPAIFDRFEVAHIVHYVEGKPVIKKPNPDFYSSFLEMRGLKPENVIFIDDRYPNIRTARSLGINTIHFKNPDQLKESLHHLGISLEQPALAA